MGVEGVGHEQFFAFRERLVTVRIGYCRLMVVYRGTSCIMCEMFWSRSCRTAVPNAQGVAVAESFLAGPASVARGCESACSASCSAVMLCNRA